MDGGVGKRLGAVFEIDLEAVLLEHGLDDFGALLRLMPAPAAPDDQCFTHSLSS